MRVRRGRRAKLPGLCKFEKLREVESLWVGVGGLVYTYELLIRLLEEDGVICLIQWVSGQGSTGTNAKALESFCDSQAL